jgi:transposase
MGRKRNFIVKESVDYLESLRSKVKDYQSSQQLNCLLLLKTGKYKTLAEVSNHIGVHYSTIQRWLAIYKTHGIDKLLAPQTRNKPSKFISPEIHMALEARLRSKENPFSGYVEVQEWLEKEYNVKIGYQWLWRYMRIKMDSSLKVPRRVNIKKEQGAEEAFLKTAVHIR